MENTHELYPGAVVKLALGDGNVIGLVQKEDDGSLFIQQYENPNRNFQPSHHLSLNQDDVWSINNAWELIGHLEDITLTSLLQENRND